MKSKKLLKVLGVVGLVIVVVALLMAGCAKPTPAPAPAPEAEEEDFPKRAVTIVVPWGVGGASDTAARKLSGGVEDILGVPVAVTNVTGAAGAIGFREFIQRPADGYTLFQITKGTTSGAIEGNNPQMDEDWIPLCLHNVIPVQLYVSSGSQFETGEDLINYATEHPRELTIGVVEVEGGDGFRVGYLADNGAEFLPVVYSKPTERTASLLGGHIDVMMARLNIVEEYIEAGKLRPVLSLTPERVSLLPDVQSLEEVGVTGLPLAQLVSFRGEVVKKGTPENRIRILANAFEKAVQYEAWIEFCKGEGTVASEIYRPAEGFRKFLEDYAASYTTKYNEIAIGLLP